MLRFLGGAVTALLLMAAGVVWMGGRDEPKAALLPPAPATTMQDGAQSEPLPDVAPAATARTREEKRFDRSDKDRNGQITREEYLANRRKAYAKLDTNGDGRLSFEEWAVKTATKFAVADADRSATLTPAEFATTAVKRKAAARLRCAPTGLGDES